MNRLVTSVIVAVVAIWLASSTIFVVDQRSSAIVFALVKSSRSSASPACTSSCRRRSRT
jgi:membrane protease subunit HflC